ncbi:MAG: T9SS type A sorting domain-containing protein, partial [Bacteroidales bacterium]|nr:T9SS type A sorting domain-containing protein [Bacteroidales bacterium]
SRGYADIVADPSEDIHSQADILSARLAFAQLGELERELHTRSNNAVRALLRDTLLDLPALESWFAATPGLSSRYSLAETEYLSGASNVLTLQGVSALLETEEERDEYDNYMAFNALKEALSGYLHGHADWPSATGTQIAELQRIAEANTGRSSVMARGVLCFFFGICEDEDFTVMGDPRHFAATGENDISSHHQDVSMKLYPNPATNTLHVELEGLDDLQGTITVADITGVVVQYVETSQHGVTIDVSHLTPGLYVVSFRNKNGVAVRKFVKM